MLKQIIKTPIADNIISRYYPTDKIISYHQLDDCKSIYDILPDNLDCCFLLYEASLNNGHWCLLSSYSDDGENVIEFFDPYGNKPDSELKWTPKSQRESIGIDEPFLTNLLKNHKVIYNKKKYQGSGASIQDCGRHCLTRGKLLHENKFTLDEYHKALEYLKQKSGMNYDEIVSSIIPDLS
jgi:hypothetical protein